MNFWRVLAHNFNAHLSGWGRFKDRARVRYVFDPKLEKWESSWEGRKHAGSLIKNKVNK